jgi:hypothetical protein
MPTARRLLVALGVMLGLGAAARVGLDLAAFRAPSAAVLATLSPRLSDQEFWRIVADSSESDGSFFRDNLTSNEVWFQRVIPDLTRRVHPGGVYLGVGPEQNFTYIAAVQPRMAIIFDIRRGNLDVQLMYKSIFELSADRADFVSMLFSRPRPSGLGPKATADELFAAFAASRGSDALYRRNLKAIRENLTTTHGMPLSPADLRWIEYVLSTFYRQGYAVRPSPTYDELMTATDEAQVSRSYLATEANFTVLKDLESKNLVVPVVGDFGGPKAIRAVGAYLKSHDATVSAFYLSNVEDYLYQDNKWAAFCRNVAALPLDSSSTFIRSTSRGRVGGFGGGFGGGFISSLGVMADEVKHCGGVSRR